MLNFSEFAKILYPYCGRKDNQADFVITLTSKIITKDVAFSTDSYSNPMINKDRSTRNKLFNGTQKKIPRKTANLILLKLSRSRFERFINTCSENARMSIAEELTERGVSSVNYGNVGTKCADIFEIILISGEYVES
jgi:hypothetical protein